MAHFRSRGGWTQGKARACYVGSREQRAEAILRAIREAPLRVVDLHRAHEVLNGEEWDEMPEREGFADAILRRMVTP